MLKRNILSLLVAFVFCHYVMAGSNTYNSTVAEYALLSSDSTTIIFYCDTLMAEREGSACPIVGYEDRPEWSGASSNVEHVVFDSSFASANPTNMSGWFEGMGRLEDVVGLDYVNTSGLTKVDRMFSGCSSLRMIDFSSFVINSGVTTSLLLGGCTALDTLKVNGSMVGISADACQGVGSQGQRCVIVADIEFDFWTSTTSGDMEWKSGLFTVPPPVPYVVVEGSTAYKTMTFFCDREPYLLSDDDETMSNYHFLVDNGYERSWEFPNDDGGQVTVDVIFDSSFAIARPTSTASWFYSPVNAATLEPEVQFVFTGLEYLNTSMVEDMSNMFSGCTYMTDIPLEGFDTSSVTLMDGMFKYCLSLTSVGISGFNTANVVDMSGMFYGCRQLQTLDLKNFNTENVTDMSEMFYGCTNLSSLDLTQFNTSKVENMHRMFANCHSLCSLRLGSFSTSNVAVMEGMFARCLSLEDVDVSSFDTSSVIDMSGMFYLCASLSALSVGNFNTSAVEEIGNMFGGCASLEKLDLSNFDMSNVEGYENVEYYIMDDEDSAIEPVFDGFLYGCTALDTLYIPLTMTALPDDAFHEVGLLSPCVLIVPDGYDFGDLAMDNPLQWCGGTFKLVRENGDEGTLSVSADRVLAGRKGNIVISFVNGYHFYNGFQFELHLPENVVLAKNGRSFDYFLDERCGPGVTATIRDFGNGSYRVLCYSLSNDTIQGLSGPLMTLSVGVADDTPSGIYEAFITNVIFSQVDGVSEDVADISFDLVVDNFPEGDVDHDYKVNVVDVMLVINHVLGTTGSTFHEESADLNHDGRIDVTDVMAIVVAILNKDVAETEGVAALLPPAPFSVMPSDGGVSLQVADADSYAACQMRVVLPEGDEITGIVTAAASHRVAWKRMGHGVYNVVVYPINGMEAQAGLPQMEILTASGNPCGVTLKGIMLTDKHCQGMAVADVETEPTGIYPGIVDADGTPAYHINGVRYGTKERGIYVKNGRKYFRK